MNVSIIGLGFVGLATALSFAKKGNTVYGIDIDKKKIDLLNEGKIYSKEPYLEEVLKEELNVHFFPSQKYDERFLNSDVVFLTLPTDSSNDGSANLSAIFDCLDTLCSIFTDGSPAIVIKSSIPPSSFRDKICPFFVKKNASNLLEKMAICPEFLREGHAWEDVIKPDRIVVGCDSVETKNILEKLYKPFNTKIIFTNPTTGEFIKYLSNSLLANLISFSNEMAFCADYIGDVDISKAFKTLWLDKRLNGSGIASYIYPGIGYGGYCLPKDTKGLLSVCQGKAKLLKTIIEINEERPSVIARQIEEKTNENDKILYLGLSFKPNIDDIRESTAIKVISQTKRNNYRVFDPLIKDSEAIDILRHKHANSLEEGISWADIIVILVNWDIFYCVDYGNKPVLDFRYQLGDKTCK